MKLILPINFISVNKVTEIFLGKYKRKIFSITVI